MPAGGASPDEAAVRFFQALGDATRLRLLGELKDDPRTVGELVDALGCPQPKVSRHLKVLKEAGLVVDRRDGRNVTYATTRRRTWPPEARAWLDRLDVGLAVGVDAAGDSRSARNQPRRAMSSAPPRAAAPTPPDPPAPTPRPGHPPVRKRRADLDTHLL